DRPRRAARGLRPRDDRALRDRALLPPARGPLPPQGGPRDRPGPLPLLEAPSPETAQGRVGLAGPGDRPVPAADEGSPRGTPPARVPHAALALPQGPPEPGPSPVLRHPPGPALPRPHDGHPDVVGP